MTGPDLAEVFGAQWPRVLATLRADLGDLDAAEDAVQHAFAVATDRWGEHPPDNPGAWLTTVARRWAIDQFRRQRRFDDRLRDLVPSPDRPPEPIRDELLAMIFGCCHPALDEAARIVLTLRYVVGVRTEDIARAFLVPEPTMAKRLVRAKKKIAAANIPFRVPDPSHLTERLEAVLRIVYLLFTQGHTSPSGPLIRGSLCDEARWLAGQVCVLLPREPEAWGLASLLATTDARRGTRVDDAGEVVLLAQQNRERWDGAALKEGRTLLARALALRRVGTYQLQAAIALVHGRAPRHADTDWPTIVRLYRALVRLDPSPVVRLNEAVAASFATDAEQGLARVESLAGELAGYHYFHVAHADMLARCGRDNAARAAYRDALACCPNPAERRSIVRSARVALGRDG